MEEWEKYGLDKRVDYDNLGRVFERMDLKVRSLLGFTWLLSMSQKDGKIDVQELTQAYKVNIPSCCSNSPPRRQNLGYHPRKRTEYGLSEVEDIIWEVDEDANGWIDWDNFVQLYVRCRKDRTGQEPTRLYNLIEFMVCDKDGGGTMSEDECMEILYHRYGKEVRQGSWRVGLT